MTQMTLAPADWAKLESLIILAAKIAGQTEPLSEKSALLEKQTAQLHAGVASLVTRRQLKTVTNLATESLKTLSTMSEMEQRLVLIGTIGRVAYRYNQPNSLEEVIINLMVIALNSPGRKNVKHSPVEQWIALGILTDREKMLISFLILVGSELGKSLSAMQPLHLSALQKMRDFFVDQLTQIPSSSSSQMQMTQITKILSRPNLYNLPPNLHWHNVACSGLAFGLRYFDSDTPSLFFDQTIIVLLESRIDLNSSYIAKKSSN